MGNFYQSCTCNSQFDTKNIISMILSERKVNINVIPNQETLMKIYCDDAIRLLNNKFCGLSSSSGYASLLFDQEVPKKTPTTAPSSQSEGHLTVFCINQIVPGFFVYYLNVIWPATYQPILFCIIFFIKTLSNWLLVGSNTIVNVCSMQQLDDRRSLKTYCTT